MFAEVNDTGVNRIRVLCCPVSIQVYFVVASWEHDDKMIITMTPNSIHAKFNDFIAGNRRLSIIDADVL